MFTNLLANLKIPGAILWAIASITMLLLIGTIDLFTGSEFNFSLFYLVPIYLASWFVGRSFGILISAASTFTWVASDIASGNAFPSLVITLWNALIHFGFFAIVTLLLVRLRNSYKKEQELARLDRTTGVANSRYFYELAQFELDHARRFGNPFTLAYFDLDNFKTVNDRLGHAGGDEVLQTISAVSQRVLRKTDVVARLGGDEFAILLPGTNREGAEKVMSELHKSLITEMESHDWSVTFSIGVVSFIQPPASVDAMIHFADELMYAVKHDTKNGVRYETYTG
jgi:diguanylate cyclase (GGDEF)-like protein